MASMLTEEDPPRASAAGLTMAGVVDAEEMDALLVHVRRRARAADMVDAGAPAAGARRR